MNSNGTGTSSSSRPVDEHAPGSHSNVEVTENPELKSQSSLRDDQEGGNEADFDDILYKIGQFGRYQKRIYLLLCLPAMYMAMVTLSYSFVGAIPKHRCRVPCDNITNPKYKDSFLDWTVPRKVHHGPDSESAETAAYQECRRFKPLLSPPPTSSGADPEDANKFDQQLMDSFGGGQQTSEPSLVQVSPHHCPAVSFSENETEHCVDGWVFDDSTYASTIVTEFGLVCDRARWQSFVSGTYMAGMLAGAFLMGYLSDRIGRKPAFFLSLGITALAGFLAAFSPNVETFLAIKFITGIGAVATFQTCFVLALEYVGPDYRMVCGICIEFFFAGGEILVGVVAYWIRDWFPLQIFFHIIGLLFFVYFWFIPESARWQMATGRNADARKTLVTIGEVNGSPAPKHMLPADNRHAKTVIEKDAADETMLDLLKIPRLRMQFFNISYAWFVNVLVYYGLGMTSTSLGGDVHLTYILTMLIEFPAYFLCLLVLNRFGRRLSFSVLLIIGGVACLLTGVVPIGWYIVKMCLSLLGKLCISCTFAIAFVYTGELYPTVVRNAGIGAASTCARLGGILAPFISDLGTIHTSLPYIVFGTLTLLSGVLSLDLPDTLGVKLPETIEEAAEFAKGKGIFTCCQKNRTDGTSLATQKAAETGKC